MNLKSIKKNIKNYHTDIENSAVGSVCTTIAILNGGTTDEAERLFSVAKKHLKTEFSFRKLFKTLWNESNKCPAMKALVAKAILLTDNNNLYTPIVTFMHQDAAMPLNRNGIQAPLIRAFNEEKDFVYAEPLFDSIEDFDKEETLW